VCVVDTSQVVTAASQTEEHFEEQYHVNVIETILTHTIDIKRGNLIDELAAKDVLSPDETQTIRRQKTTDVKVQTLLVTLREKSSDQFESFLTTLGETGQQSVVDVVRQALHKVGRTGQNPLQNTYGALASSHFYLSSSHQQQI